MRATERFWPSSPSDVRVSSISYHAPRRRHNLFLPSPPPPRLELLSPLMMDSFEYALSAILAPLLPRLLSSSFLASPSPPSSQIPTRAPPPPPSTRQILSMCLTRSYTPHASVKS